jgi:hypothetical protein
VNLNDLRKSPLLQSLSDEEIKQLVDNAEPVSLRAGETLIRQGEPGDAAYVLLKGEFEVQMQSGQTLIKIGVRNPGEIVGEMALLSRSPRNASVISKTGASPCASLRRLVRFPNPAQPDRPALGDGAAGSKRRSPPPEREDGRAGHAERRAGP